MPLQIFSVYGHAYYKCVLNNKISHMLVFRMLILAMHVLSNDK
jgi:hypothetical protein